MKLGQGRQPQATGEPFMQEKDSYAGINSLSSSTDGGQAPTGDELFSITKSEVLTLLKPLKDRIEELEKNQELLFKNQDLLIDQLLALKKKDEDRQIDIERSEKIAIYIHNRPDHKSRFETLKGHLKIGDAQLTGALAVLEKNYPGAFVKVKDDHDKRKRWLVEIPKLSSRYFPGK
jgi:hypothetical protein